jgi:DNA-binding GntR family transcriptional regulator
MTDGSHAAYCKAYRLLKIALVEHRFRPGEQLMVADLADHLRVSNTPVREALICLRAEALLDTSSRRGFFVKIISYKEIIELYELAHLLVSSAIEQGVASDELRSSNELPCEQAHVIARSTDPDCRQSARFYAGALEKIHERLVVCSGKTSTAGFLRNIHDRTHYIRTIDLEQPERLNELITMMHLTASAVEKKDVSLAVDALARTLNATVERIPALVKEGVGRACTPSPGPLWSDGEVGHASPGMRQPWMSGA